MLPFLLTQSITNEVTDVVTEAVTDKVSFFSVDSLTAYFRDSFPNILDFLVSLIIAFLVLLIGRRIIKIAGKLIHKFMEKTNWDEGVRQFLEHVLGFGMHFLLIMMVLAKFGVTASTVIAVIGSVGLSVGLALQGSLSNFAGGVLILILKPFKIGEYIIEDTHQNEGYVTDINLCYTKLRTLEGRTVVLPNGDLANSSLTNLSHRKKLLVKIDVNVSYYTDLRTAKKVLTEVMENEHLLLPDEPNKVVVVALADSAVTLQMRLWVLPRNYWEVFWRTNENIKYALDEAGIIIPFPQLTVGFDKKSKCSMEIVDKSE